MSERRAVKVLGAHRSAIRYRPKHPALDAPIRKRVEEIAAARIRYGSRRIYILLEREGWRVNLKRVYRIYCLAGLNLRSKRPKRCCYQALGVWCVGSGMGVHALPNQLPILQSGGSIEVAETIEI